MNSLQEKFQFKMESNAQPSDFVENRLAPRADPEHIPTRRRRD